MLAGAAVIVPAQAALNISNTPLFTSNAVKPNLILSIDDSGSMESEVLFESNDGALWWNTADDRFVNSGAVNFNTSGVANDTWRKFTYLFPNGTGTGDRVYADADHNHYAIPPLPQYAFTRASVYNKMYYDPNVTYEPWAAYGTTSFADIVPTSAPSDPTAGTSAFDLTTTISSNSANHVFKMYDGMKVPAGTEYNTGSGWSTAVSTVSISSTQGVGITYYPATYYVPVGSGGYTVNGNPGTCASPVPGHYTVFKDNPSSLAGIDALGPDGGCLQKIQIKSTTSSYAHDGSRTDCAGATSCDYNEEITNFSNWFGYYRKRHLALRAGMGQAFTGMNNIRTGIFTINDRDPVTMWDMANSSDADTFFSTLYDISGNGGGTPNREALDYAGQQFMRTDATAPIIEACQKNFTLHFTDGFSSLSGTLPNPGNQDGGEGAPYADGFDDTFADIAMDYYKTRLRNDLPSGLVPIHEACSTTTPAPILDCNADLHMSTYTVGLGAKGTLFGITHNTVADAYASPPTWPDTNAARDSTQIDDLYHAAVNGRGEMFNAASAHDLKDKLQSALISIQAQIGSSAAVATNSTRLDTNTLIYQARFNSLDWSGQLLAFAINADGSIGAQQWDAADLIPSPASRDIFSYDDTSGSETGIGFQWANLNATQKGYLGATVSEQQDVVGYIRGVQGNEQQNGGGFRNRSSVLGDIIDSDPWFVGQGKFGYQTLPGTVSGTEGFEYPAFLLGKASRSKMLYVGANDGMLHAFDAATGVERFAYVPAAVIPMLKDLSLPTYGSSPAHEYFVNGSPRAGDVFYSGSWHTVLVGTTGAGGRGVFALDVSDPDNFGAGDVLWELTSAIDGDLGYTLPQPSIVRMANGEWAAIVGNGYNSDNERAVLFIVNIETGSVIQKIDTLVGSASAPNGLATPIAVDVDGDRIVDSIYAGDLLGNLWKFDVDDSNTNQWKSAFGPTSAPEPLFVACNEDPCVNTQPITAKPQVGKNPDGEVMVYFGSGKYFEIGDNNVGASPQVHTYYGIRDDGSQVSGRDDLQEQTIDAEVSAFGFDLRVTSNQQVDYSVKQGWFMDLVSPVSGAEGERVVSPSLLRGDRLVFATLIPQQDPCSFGGTGWLMELDAVNGARLDKSPFDVNGDGVFDDADLIAALDTDGDGDVDSDDDEVPVSGKKSTIGIIKTPSVISAGHVEYKYTSGSSGGLEVTTESGGSDGGRQAWRQLQ
jgi:type IV pilus assembly protein PilY1